MDTVNGSLSNSVSMQSHDPLLENKRTHDLQMESTIAG